MSPQQTARNGHTRQQRHGVGHVGKQALDVGPHVTLLVDPDMCSGVSGLHTTVIRVRMRRENTLPSNVPGATVLTPTVCSSSTAGINRHHAFLTTALPDRLLHHAHPGVSNVIAVTS